MGHTGELGHKENTSSIIFAFRRCVKKSSFLIIIIDALAVAIEIQALDKHRNRNLFLQTVRCVTNGNLSWLGDFVADLDIHIEEISRKSLIWFFLSRFVQWAHPVSAPPASPSSAEKPGPWARLDCTAHWLCWRAGSKTPLSYWNGCRRASGMEE